MVHRHLIFFFVFLILPASLRAQSQNSLLPGAADADYYVMKVEYTWSNGWMASTRIMEKKWPVKFQRNTHGVEKIILQRGGVVEEIYTPDIPDYPVYFTDNVNRLTGYKGFLFYYQKAGEGEKMIKYILHTDKAQLEALTDMDALEKGLADYLAEEKKNQAGARNELITQIENEREHERELNSIKGKNITRLEIVWLTGESETGLQSKISYGIKAYDDKGKVYSTNTLGGKTPWEDFDVVCSGGEPGYEFLQVPATCQGLQNDKVILTVTSRYQPQIKISSSIRLSYTTPVYIDYSGKTCGVSGGSDRASGGRGGVNLTLYVCNSPDGQYHLLEVKDGVGTLLHRIKVKQGVVVGITSRGGNGCSGSNNLMPGHGGDGGDITIIYAPGTDISFLNINNSGGKPGSGGGTARTGADGRRSEMVQQVNLNF